MSERKMTPAELDMYNKHGEEEYKKYLYTKNRLEGTLSDYEIREILEDAFPDFFSVDSDFQTDASTQQETRDSDIIQGLGRLNLGPPKKKSKQNVPQSSSQSSTKVTRRYMPSQSHMPHCLRTSDNFKLSGRFGRYNQLRNYDNLNSDYNDVYNLLLQYFPHAVHLISLGAFRITIRKNSITFHKIGWRDGRDLYLPLEQLSKDQFDALQTNATFRRFMNSFITKTVQDRMVQKEFKFQLPKTHTFDVVLNLYNNRTKSDLQDLYHQDHYKFIDADYFTLTYLLPANKTILSASILVSDNSNPANYSGVSIPVSNLCTLAVSNYDMSVPPVQGRPYPHNLQSQYHSTPAITTSRSFINPTTNSRNTLGNHNRPTVQGNRQAKVNVLLDGFSQYTTQDQTVNLVPFPLPDLDEKYAFDMDNILQDSHVELRTFIRCWYCNFSGLHDNELSSQVYTIDGDLLTLLLETYIITNCEILDEVTKYFIGGRKSIKKINFSEAIKLMQNPKSNIMVSYNPCKTPNSKRKSKRNSKGKSKGKSTEKSKGKSKDSF